MSKIGLLIEFYKTFGKFCFSDITVTLIYGYYFLKYLVTDAFEWFSFPRWRHFAQLMKLKLAADTVAVPPDTETLVPDHKSNTTMNLMLSLNIIHCGTQPNK